MSSNYSVEVSEAWPTRSYERKELLTDEIVNTEPFPDFDRESMTTAEMHAYHSDIGLPPAEPIIPPGADTFTLPPLEKLKTSDFIKVDLKPTILIQVTQAELCIDYAVQYALRVLKIHPTLPHAGLQGSNGRHCDLKYEIRNFLQKTNANNSGLVFEIVPREMQRNLKFCVLNLRLADYAKTFYYDEVMELMDQLDPSVLAALEADILGGSAGVDSAQLVDVLVAVDKAQEEPSIVAETFDLWNMVVEVFVRMCIWMEKIRCSRVAKV
ncbi:hypothetical protein BS50DRAFT_588867 [Corynespora cassiicola Philippines]|uniref:Uncharacterized protein n=1 Tax=Corynespora cassiicola Philippines TaxID=1448308 RepID=A0A2T2NL00_CORCC|nr:hypothetical protein BS50DRAFT_588867 [Corynespora cassiicola Philippines]